MPVHQCCFLVYSSQHFTADWRISPLFYHYGEDKDYVNRLHFHQYKIGYIPTVYGCHDREFRKVSFEGFLRAERVYLLSEYANINYHFTQAFAYGILAGIKKLTIALLKGNIKYAKGYASTVFSLLKQSKAVIQVRKQTKQIHASYL